MEPVCLYFGRCACCRENPLVGALVKCRCNANATRVAAAASRHNQMQL